MSSSLLDFVMGEPRAFCLLWSLGVKFSVADRIGYVASLAASKICRRHKNREQPHISSYIESHTYCSSYHTIALRKLIGIVPSLDLKITEAKISK